MVVRDLLMYVGVDLGGYTFLLSNLPRFIRMFGVVKLERFVGTVYSYL